MELALLTKLRNESKCGDRLILVPALIPQNKPDTINEFLFFPLPVVNVLI